MVGVENADRRFPGVDRSGTPLRIVGESVEVPEAEFDPDARTAIYGKAFDRINEMQYHVPISSVPQVFVHSKDVKVSNNPLSAGKIYATDFKWN